MKFINRIKRYVFRNRYLMNGEKVIQNRVNLEYYDSVKNLGDMLSPVIVDFMLHRKKISSDHPVEHRCFCSRQFVFCFEYQKYLSADEKFLGKSAGCCFSACDDGALPAPEF